MRGLIWASVTVSGALLAAGPASASHHTATHHASKASYHASSKKAAPSHHESGKHGSSKHTSSRHDKKPAPAKSAAPSGATNVPSGGIKLFCGPGRSPLMVRKMTQGSGTTVTVICR